MGKFKKVMMGGLGMLLCTMTACGTAQNTSTAQDNAAAQGSTAAQSTSAIQETSGKETVGTDGNVLVVYFSCTGNTKNVAAVISQATGGTLYEITPVDAYTEEDLNYNDANSRTSVEQSEPGVRPQISGEIADWQQYSTVYVGYPIWWGEEPRIMDTFVESYDFEGKTVIPFCTSSLSGIGSSDTDLSFLAGGGNWLSGQRFADKASAEDVTGWLSGLNLGQ